jgi:SNF2 family DNA or RNA helicase
MRDLVPEGRILVVATGDAIGVWQDEVELWLDEETSVYAGPGAKLEALTAGGFVLTNYSRLAAVFEHEWDGIIFDESQMLRNRKTRTLFITVRSAFNQSHRGFDRIPVFFLSGTPIVKAAGDLWPILHLIDKHRWSSYWKFVQKYAITWEDQFGWHVEGVTNAKGLWNEELAGVCLRRLEGEVPLPDKVRQRVPLTMTPRQAKLYRQLEVDMIAEIDNPGGLLLTPSVLARETRLRQALACPRILGVDDDGAAIAALVAIAERNPDPFVVFSPFAEALPYLEKALFAATKRPVYVIRGGMGDRFGKSVQFFKQSTAAGEGPILLSTVQMGKSWSVAEQTHDVYMLCFDWNATTMLQAESRLHREGQKDTVFARYFTHEATHDQAALDVLASKKRLSDVILDRYR